MTQNLPQAERKVKQEQRRRTWKKFVRVMACIVVFCTTYSLILPAITMEKPTVCGMQEHVHEEACYTQQTTVQVSRLNCSYETLGVHRHTNDCTDAQGELLCGYADFLVHIHDEACCPAGVLQCALPEVGVHAHSEECYIVTAETEGHTHSEDCYTVEPGEIGCGLSEEEPHHHEDSCYTVSLELVCTAEEDEAHTHGDVCYAETKTQTCTQDETEGHLHTDDCREQLSVLTCEQEEIAAQEAEVQLSCEKLEIVLHSHTADCFDEEENLTCTKRQVLSHVHTEDCLVTEEQAVDPEALSCTLMEDEEHTHGALCYGQWTLSCEQEEHTHTEECWETEQSTAATEESQPVTDESQPVTDETQPVTDETQPATEETQPATDENDLESASVEETEPWSIAVNDAGQEGESPDGAQPIDHSDKLPAGAVFALYSPEQTEQMDEIPAEYASVQKIVSVNGTDWYLTRIGVSDETGSLRFDELLQEQYYLMEVKAPEGYILPENNGQILNRSDAVQDMYSLTVVNDPGYTMPSTGGAGTNLYTMGGMLLMTAAGILLLYSHITWRRKEAGPSLLMRK